MTKSETFKTWKSDESYILFYKLDGEDDDADDDYDDEDFFTLLFK